MPSLRRFCEHCTDAAAVSPGRMDAESVAAAGKSWTISRPHFCSLLAVFMLLAFLPSTADADGQILVWSQHSHRWTKLRGIFGPPHQWLANQVKKYYTSESARDKIYNHLAYDHKHRFIYWHDAQEKSIFRQPINDSLVQRRTDTVEVVFEGMSEDIGGIAMDWLSGNVYWTDNTKDMILATRWHPTRKDMYFVAVKDLLDHPTGIAVDPANGLLYWADMGADKAIASANLDGSNKRRMTEVNGVEDVTSLTLDLSDNHLYFLQRGAMSGDKQRVSRLNVASGEVSDVLTLDNTYYSAIAAHGDYIFLTNVMALQIETFSKGGIMLHSYIIDAIPHGIVVTAPLAPQHTPPTDCDKLDCSDFCISVGNGRAECRCQEEHYFQLDERSCVSSSPRYIYSIDGDLWDAKATISTNPDRVRLKESQIVVGKVKIQAIGYQFVKNTVYFSDTDLNDIYRGNPDSRTFEKHTVNEYQVEGLSVNWLSDTVYWSDAVLRHIMVSQFDGRYHSILLEDAGQPRGIAVDAVHGYLFFVNGQSPAALERTSTDGLNRKVIVSSNLVQPQSVAVDPRTKRVYWTDSSPNAVHSCDLDGGNRETAQTNIGPNLYGVTLYRSYITWTQSNVIPQFGLNGFHINDVQSNIDHSQLVTFHNTQPAQTYAIVTYNQYLQPALLGPCVRNGGCKQLCFPTPEGHTCGCAIGYTLNKDGETCDTAMLETEFLLFVDPYHKAIYQLHTIDLKRAQAVPVALMDFPVSMDLDPGTGKMYWIDQKQRVIKGSYTDGSDVTTVWSWEQDDERDPSFIIFNREDDKLYFTDKGVGKAGIYSVRKSGGTPKLILGGLIRPSAIAPDYANRLLYYVDPGNKPNEARIGVVKTNGQDHQHLIAKDLNQPSALTYIIKDQLLLWADQSRGTVYSYNVSTAATSVVVADPTKNIISLTADEKNIYFTAHHHKSVFVAERGVPVPEIKEVTLPIFARIFDVKAYPDIFLVPPAAVVTPPGMSMLYLGVGIAAAILLALLFIILALCLLRRKRKPKDAATSDLHENTYDEVERDFIGMANPVVHDMRGGDGHARVPNGRSLQPGGQHEGHGNSRSHGYGRESIETIDVDFSNGHAPVDPQISNGHSNGHVNAPYGEEEGAGDTNTLAMAAVAVAASGGLKKTKHRKYTQKNKQREANGFELTSDNGKVATVIQRLASRLRTGISSIRWNGEDDGKSSRRSKRSSRPPSDQDIEASQQGDDLDPNKGRFQKRPPIGPVKPQLHRLPQGFSPASRVTPSAVKATWGRNKKKMMGKKKQEHDQYLP